MTAPRDEPHQKRPLTSGFASRLAIPYRAGTVMGMETTPTTTAHQRKTGGRIDSRTGRWLTAAEAAAQDAEITATRQTLVGTWVPKPKTADDLRRNDERNSSTAEQRAAYAEERARRDAAEAAARAAEAAARAAANTCDYCDEYLDDAAADYCDARCERDHERWG